MSLNSRQDLADYCLRALGAPVINIEIADEQIADAMEEAINFWKEYHFDAIDRDYVKHQFATEDITNRWITVPEDIVAIRRVLPWTPGFGDGLFDITYQLRMNDLRNLSSGTLNYFTSTMDYLELLDFQLRKEKQFRFNRRMNRLYLDINWSGDVQVGQYLIIECYRAIDPDRWGEVFNDIWLKKYALAITKRYWGSNLRKYQGIALPGGIVLDGERIHAEAIQEMKEVEQIIQSLQGPCEFFVG